MEEDIKKGLNDYNELKEKVKNYKGTFEELCKELGGFNVCEEYFDLDYKSITATIKHENGKIFLSPWGIEIWDNEGNNVKHIDNIEKFNIKEVK